MALVIAAAFILDSLLGDPKNPLHPVRIIGKGVSTGVAIYEKTKAKSPAAQFVLGMILTIVIVVLSFFVTKLILWGCYHLNFWFGLAVETVICYFLIAAKALKDESMKVYRSLEQGNIEEARNNLSYIVGRETKNLNEKGIVKSAVETIAENLSDGVIGPLIFIAVGGAPLGMAYKAVNTLDSMIGYRNEKFEYFGKFAARLDDVVNIIPARASALLMLFGCLFVSADIKRAGRIYLRDRYNHKSPNAAHTEAVCAGALGLRLGGDNYYDGILVHKPTIGDDVYEPVFVHIAAANRLMYSASISAVVFIAAGSLTFAILRGCGHV